MKKLLLCLPLVASACAQPKAVQSVSTAPVPAFNENCADVQKYRIFQVMRDGALASACESEYGIETCYGGLVVYIPKKKGQIYYDEMIVKPTNGQCIIYDEVYRYPAKNGLTKTVPKIKFVGP